MGRLRRVFIDTNELFPFTIMDLLLTFAEDFLFTWVWTDEILDEREEVIVREGRRTPESAASVASAVRTHFSRYRIDPAVYRDTITEDLSPDPADRMHAAAAIYGNVDVLVTRNLKHLRTEPVLAAGIEVIAADDFLCALLEHRGRGVVESFIRAADGKTDPPMTVADLAQKVSIAGAPQFAERIRKFLPRWACTKVNPRQHGDWRHKHVLPQRSYLVPVRARLSRCGRRVDCDEDRDQQGGCGAEYG